MLNWNATKGERTIFVLFVDYYCIINFIKTNTFSLSLSLSLSLCLDSLNESSPSSERRCTFFTKLSAMERKFSWKARMQLCWTLTLVLTPTWRVPTAASAEFAPVSDCHQAPSEKSSGSARRTQLAWAMVLFPPNFTTPLEIFFRAEDENLASPQSVGDAVVGSIFPSSDSQHWSTGN